MTLAISASTRAGAELQIDREQVSGELPLPVHQNQTIVITGTSSAYTVTCTTGRGSPEAGAMSFTASPAELVWIYPPSGPSGSATRVATFTRD